MPDVTCNLDEMAAKLRISLPTMRKLAKTDGFPAIHVGRNGVPWQLDPEAVIRWVHDRRVAEASGRAARDEALAQITLPDDLLSAPDQVGLSTRERLQIAQAQRVEMQTAREAGFLVDKSELRGHLMGVWNGLMQALLSLPQQVGRRHNLPDPVIRDMRRFIEGQLRATHRQLGDLLPADAEAPAEDDHAAAA